MKSVGAIVTFDNVLVNNQNESDPSLIDFDLNNKSKAKTKSKIKQKTGDRLRQYLSK